MPSAPRNPDPDRRETLRADVAVLRAATRVAGKVVEKTDHYEVTIDGVLKPT